MKTLSFELHEEQRCEIIFGKNINVFSLESIFVMDSGLNNIMSKISGDVHILPGGEHVKSIDRVFELYQLFRTKGQSRAIALGGGAIIDLVGYSAFSHSQIEEFYAMPSTSLSQTLLPLHGKFYINFEFKKDMLEIYGLPNKIYIDPEWSYSRFLERGNCELLPFLLIAFSYDKHAFRYLERLLGNSEKLSMDTWTDILWLAIKIYSERVNNNPGVIGMGFANILESAFRLKLDFLNAIAFGAVFELWLGKIFGVVRSEENLLVYLRKFWSRQWPLRLDFSSINEYISQTRKLELDILCFGNSFHAKIDAEDFINMLKDHGKELESLL